MRPKETKKKLAWNKMGSNKVELNPEQAVI